MVVEDPQGISRLFRVSSRWAELFLPSKKSYLACGMALGEGSRRYYGEVRNKILIRTFTKLKV